MASFIFGISSGKLDTRSLIILHHSHVSAPQPLWLVGLLRVYTNSPSLEAGVLVSITLKDLERNALFAKALGEAEATDAPSNNEYVHDRNDCEIGK